MTTACRRRRLEGKKMKKRFLSLVLALTFVLCGAATLASCGETSTLDYGKMDLSGYITLGDYLNLTVDAAKVDEITAESLAEEIMKLRVQNATAKMITDRAVLETDTIKFTYELKKGDDTYETAKTQDKYDISVDGVSETATLDINKKAFGDQLVGMTLDTAKEITVGENTYRVTVVGIYDYHKTNALKEDGTTEEAAKLTEKSIVSVTFTKTVDGVAEPERTEPRVNFANVGKSTHDWYQSDFINALIGKKVGETVTVETKNAKFEIKINYIYEQVTEPAPEDLELVGKALGYTTALKKETNESDADFEARKATERLEFISKKMKLAETLKKGESESDADFDARVFKTYSEWLEKTLKEDREEQLYINKVNAVWTKAIENAKVLKYVKKNLKNYVKETIDNLNTDYYNNESMYEMYESYGITGYYKHYESLGDFIADNTDYSKDNYESEIEKKAEEVAKEAMVLYAIAKKENVTVSDEEYKARIAEYAEDAGYEDTTKDGVTTTATEAFLAAYANYYTEEQLREAVLWEKVVAKLAEGATVNYK